MNAFIPNPFAQFNGIFSFTFNCIQLARYFLPGKSVEELAAISAERYSGRKKSIPIPNPRTRQIGVGIGIEKRKRQIVFEWLMDTIIDRHHTLFSIYIHARSNCMQLYHCICRQQLPQVGVPSIVWLCDNPTGCDDVINGLFKKSADTAEAEWHLCSCFELTERHTVLGDAVAMAMLFQRALARLQNSGRGRLRHLVRARA